MAKADALQREKEVRSEVEKEMEIDRLRRKHASRVQRATWLEHLLLRG